MESIFPVAASDDAKAIRDEITQAPATAQTSRTGATGRKVAELNTW